VLIWFVTLDIVFIALHSTAFALRALSVIDKVPAPLKITEDGALPEIYNYIKWSIIVVALLWSALRDLWIAPLAWAAVFTMILLDDALQFHETLGNQFATDMALPSGDLLYGSDLGEIIVFVSMALVAVILTVMLFARRGVESRQMSIAYCLVLAGLATFGVGVDALHQIASHLAQGHPAVMLLGPVAALIEDGGEMLVASVAVAVTLTSRWAGQT
jgi:hypothetical protein